MRKPQQQAERSNVLPVVRSLSGHGLLEVKMKIVPVAVTQALWQNLIKFGEEYIKENPADGFATCHIKPNSPAAFPACLDWNNQPLNNLSKAHVDNSTCHHCYVSFAVQGSFKQLRGLEVLHIWSDCYIVSASIETWYELIVKKLTTHGDTEQRRLLCHVLLHLEKLGFRDMFSKFEKNFYAEGLYNIKEV
jgi:hypothetical protein